MFVATFFTIAKIWKQLKCPSTDEWIKKTWYTYTTEYHSALRKNEILSFATTWIKLKVITLDEISLEQKNKLYISHLFVGAKNLNN